MTGTASLPNFSDTVDRAEVAAGAENLMSLTRAHRLAEMRNRLGPSQAEASERMHTSRGADRQPMPFRSWRAITIRCT